MTNAQFKAKRLSLGWSQRQLAEAIGVTTHHVSAIENNRAPVSKPLQIILTFYRFGDWPGRPTGASPEPITPV